MDQATFYDQMKSLGACLGRKVEKDTIDEYYKIFGKYKDFEFERVCAKAKETCDSFPKPVELKRVAVDLGYEKQRRVEDSTKHLISVECICGYSFVVDPARLEAQPEAYLPCINEECNRSFQASFILNKHVGGFLSIHPDFEQYFKNQVPDGSRPDLKKLQEQMEFE